MKRSKQQNKVIGQLGETIASKFLVNKGFTIIERNYWRKWGELDLVARATVSLSQGSVLGDTPGKVHFVEVKTVSYETKHDLEEAVSRGTWRPEEQVHQFKLHQIHKALETWIADHKYAGDWQIDVITVRVVPRERFATVKHIENITN
jgi:putative endonuclease